MRGRPVSRILSRQVALPEMVIHLSPQLPTRL